MSNTELENKAGRETIQRLVAEINKEQKLTVDNINSVEKMRLVGNIFKYLVQIKRCFECWFCAFLCTLAMINDILFIEQPRNCCEGFCW